MEPYLGFGFSLVDSISKQLPFTGPMIFYLLNFQAVLESPSSVRCNATGLTKGKYVFKLVVKDNLDNAAESSVEVTVNQDSNSAPVANAGADVLVSFIGISSSSII